MSLWVGAQLGAWHIIAVLPKSIVIVDHTIYDLILFC